MKELLPENEDPLNQISKKALIKLGVKPDNQLLYVLQLMLWQLRENKEDYITMPFKPGASAELGNYTEQVELVEDMQTWNPKTAMHYLQSFPKEEEEEPGDNLFKGLEKEDLEPEDLASLLAELLFHRMAADNSGFPIKGLQAVFPLT